MSKKSTTSPKEKNVETVVKLHHKKAEVEQKASSSSTAFLALHTIMITIFLVIIAGVV